MGLMFLTRKRQPRSNVNLSKVATTTLAPGNLVPISTTRIIAGDKLRFTPSAFVQALPMQAPLVNGFKVCFEYFFIPDRIYNSDLALNFTGVTDQPDDVKFPVLPIGAIEGINYGGLPSADQNSGTVDNEGFIFPDFANEGDFTPYIQYATNAVKAGSLADYLGYPVGYVPWYYTPNYDEEEYGEEAFEHYKNHNAVPLLGYLDIIYNYYINQQADRIPTAFCDDFIPNQRVMSGLSFSHEEIRDFLRKVKLSLDPQQGYIDALAPYRDDINAWETKEAFGSWWWYASRASIFQRAFPDYYLEGWLKTSGYDDSSVTVDISDDGNSVSLRAISAQSHIQRWLDLAMAGGSRYSDYINAEFDTSRLRNSSVPMFLGSDRQYLGSKIVVQTTGFNDDLSPLGSFAGQSSGGERFKTRSYSFGENGFFMVIASLVPDVIYRTHQPEWHFIRNLGDCYTPALDNIAMQKLMQRTVAPTFLEDAFASGVIPGEENEDGSTDTFSALFQIKPNWQAQEFGYIGYQPAWSELMHEVSSVHGRMATTMQYWTLLRRYGADLPEHFTTLWRAAMEMYKEMHQMDDGSFNHGDYEQNEFLNSFPDVYEYGFTSSPYINPVAYNNSFSDISAGAQNFVLTYGHDFIVNRLKAKVNTPTTI